MTMPACGVFSHPEFDDHESVHHFRDRKTGLRAMVAVHDTRLGPALGGCRMWAYPDEESALRDVLRLSRGMTYKAALAELPFGGGKSVILADPRAEKTPAMLRAMGRAVDSLGGRYIAAEDSGTGVEDLRLMRQETRHVAGVFETVGFDGRLRLGDPSPATAYGVFRGMEAAVRRRLGRDTLKGVRVAIQGVGNVGWQLGRYLREAGAELFVSDIREDALERATRELAARAVPAESIWDADVDVFSPCAFGAVLNDETIPRLRCSIVAGSANNQLAAPRHGAALQTRGILYAPDYAINAGGLIDVAAERTGYDPGRVRERLDGIAATLERIFAESERRGLPTSEVADQLAQERLNRVTDELSSLRLAAA